LSDAVVIGASGGIGSAFVELLASRPGIGALLALARSPLGHGGHKVRTGTIDVTDEASVADAAARAERELADLRLVIVATGMLRGPGMPQPEKSWRHITPETLLELYRVNAVGPALVAKHFVPLLPRQGRVVFAALSARVGSIGDNSLGGWHGYRASKAALNMLIRNIAIELGRKNDEAVVVGLHPGTVDTELSRPFQGGVPESRLLAPRESASRLLATLDRLGGADSGGLFAHDGARLPY
jgi:NAD(P)-dependent dehydrogenase (short-subunit alcohol dehydrogenase family)